MSLAIETEDAAGVVVVVVHGEVDIRTAPELRDSLSQVLDDGAQRVVLDLADVEFLDSTALSVMVGAHKRLARDGSRLNVVAATDAVQRVLGVTGLSRVFSVHEKRDEAVASATAAS